MQHTSNAVEDDAVDALRTWWVVSSIWGFKTRAKFTAKERGRPSAFLERTFGEEAAFLSAPALNRDNIILWFRRKTM
jgi:hypothetical protein